MLLLLLRCEADASKATEGCVNIAALLSVGGQEEAVGRFDHETAEENEGLLALPRGEGEERRGVEEAEGAHRRAGGSSGRCCCSTTGGGSDGRWKKEGGTGAGAGVRCHRVGRGRVAARLLLLLLSDGYGRC